MNRSFFRGASLCLAIISSLLVVSCSAPANKGPHTAADTAGQLCSSCVNIKVYAWKFAAYDGVDVAKLSGMAPGLAEEKTSANMQELLKNAQPAEIPKRLRQLGSAEAVLNFSSVAIVGQSLPVSTSGPAGEFSAVLTPAALTTDLPEVIRYELHAELPQGGFTRGENVYMKGNFLFKDGSALLILQKVKEGYVVWLITAKNPV
ncbi:hypothetical protein RN053_06810 [Pantoea dispersa]|uniref:hypothetical protein n=1 Tax=Pantoea dispersa TaxID=59814 RepID=UPI0028DF6677|nr:hypothetical protein [Pantoea dispersa]MDT8850190.1 hypothetical protein [Pantoea dispersa]